MKKAKALALLALALLPWPVAAQSSPDDPAVQAARKETAVVFDLGRFFAYLLTMEKESPKLALSRTQLEAVYKSMTSLKTMRRVNPAEAEKTLEYLEEQVLSPEQLMAVDQLAIAKMEAREAQSSSPSEGSGGGQITSYLAGGPFNPMTDATRTIGKDFAAFYEYVKRKLGK
jgi:hypothetical protein